MNTMFTDYTNITLFRQALCVTVISLFCNQGDVLLQQSEAYKLCLSSSMSDYVPKRSQQDYYHQESSSP